MTPKKKYDAVSEVGRRKFILAAGATAVVTSAGGATAAAQADPQSAAPTWDLEADVVVVGSGAAAGVAAAKAIDAGASVIVVEKAPIWGGTTAKSGAWYWIPNNSLMRKLGMTDPRDDAIRYMARLSYPTKYRPHVEHLGLSPLDYDLLAAFYDHAADAIDDLARMGACESQFVGGEKPNVYDYGASLPENRAPIGRGLQPKGGENGGGVLFTQRMRKFVAAKGGKILMSHRALSLITNGAGEVVGIKVQSADGIKSIRARRGVVFGSGGFTHDEALRGSFLRGPVFGGCAVPTNTGDFLRMAMEFGTELGNMTNAWWAECGLEDGLKNPSFGNTLFVPPGKSMFYVNRFGRRVVDEHMVYNERTQVHFYWDPNRFEFTNRVLIMIFDQATRTEQAGWYPIPATGESPAYLLKGEDFDALALAIDRRLQELGPKIGPIRLDSSFVANLKDTERRFARFAKAGKDDDFGRDSNIEGRLLGAGSIDYGKVVFIDKKSPDGEAKNSVGTASKAEALADTIDPNAPVHSMRALSRSGPYYAVLIGGGTLDTKGGPRIDIHGQVCDKQGKPIPGLYGAGNCIASPAGAAYHAPGGTIAMAIVFGHIAGTHAAQASVKNA